MKVVAIIGKAGSGKNTILKNIVSKSPNFNEIISCTTRPPREGEIHGKDYYFLTNQEFTDKILNNEMLEVALFNDWAYGTSYDSLKEQCINIGVFNPEGIENLIFDAKDITLMVFYVRCSDKTRLIRQLEREENPDVDEIIRRYKTDKEDFCDLNFDYIEIENEKPDDLQSCIRTIMENIV